MSVRTEPAVESSPLKFVFKSKYREDQVSLQKPQVESFSDGSKRVMGGSIIPFHRYTWSTDDPIQAEKLRAVIAQRLRLGDPIHIMETTGVEPIDEKPLRPSVKRGVRGHKGE